MYIDIVPNRNSPPAVLLRESFRDGKSVGKRTVANLSKLPMEQVALLRRVLKGEKLAPVGEVFRVERNLPHGHVEAVLGTLRKVGLDRLISWQRCRERDLVVAMIVQRVLYSSSKLADTRLWHACTLAEELGVEDADEQDLYAAMDWLLKRQVRIERKLAGRHLQEGEPVFYDVSSSYYEGDTCPLARFGHNRDGKKGRKIIVYGMLTDAQGRPVSVQVYAGNTGDPTTVPDQVQKLREQFSLEKIVLVGDRGMLTQTQIDKLEQHPGLGWVSALRGPAVKSLVESGAVQMSLFDTRNLAEIESPDYPGERLIACFNPLLAEERARKREDLLQATEKKLRGIEAEVRRRTKTPLSAAQIGQKLGKALNRFKVGKHFIPEVADNRFAWERNGENIRAEAALDGIYIIRTSESSQNLPAEEAVRQYKNLARVEEVFRTIKGTDILVRPIRHRLPARVRAHIFLCTLAYYIVWHMRKHLAPILFADETIDEVRAWRDPVAKAEPSEKAKRKRRTKRDAAGRQVHSFPTLLEALKTRCRNYCVTQAGTTPIRTVQHTPPDGLQRKAFELLSIHPV